MNDFNKFLREYLKSWSKGLKKNPLLVTLRITNICDLKCKFCTAKDEKPLKDELTIEDYKTLFSELKKLGVKNCGIVGGGEALCKRELTLELVRLIKKYNMTGWLVTNGINFDSKSIKELVLNRFDAILFSLDGANANTHDYLRGQRGAFDIVIKNIKLFNFWKNKFKTKKPELKIQILITKNNYNQIEDMIKLSKSLKMNGLLLNFLVDHTPECKNLKLNKKKFNFLKNKLKNLLQKKEIRHYTNFDEFLHIMELVNSRRIYKKNKKYILGYCYQSWYHLNITEKGDINFCPEMYKWQKNNIKTKSLEELWCGEDFNEFRKKIQEKKLINFCNKYCNLPIIVENLRISKRLENGFRTRESK